MKRRIVHRVLSLLAALGAGSAVALPERPVSVGLGFGLPDLVSAQADVVVLPPRWQIGLGFGLDGGLANSLVRSSDLVKNASQARNITLADGNEYSVSASVDPRGLSMWSPFVRFYPTKGDFYFQLTWSMLRLSSALDGTVIDPNTGSSIGGLVTGTITFVQQIPTLSIGHVFHSKAFFVNVRLGASMLFTSSCSADLVSHLPDSVGGNGAQANQEALAQVKGEIENAVIDAANQAKANVFLIPSLIISFGIIL